VPNDVLRHREALGPAVWLLLWFIDRVTKDQLSQDGESFDGLVLGGRPLSMMQIGSETGLSVRSITNYLRRLKKQRLIRSIAHSGNASGYYVCASRKFWKRDQLPLQRGALRPRPLREAAEEACKNLLDPRQTLATPSAKTCLANKETIHRRSTDHPQDRSSAHSVRGPQFSRPQEERFEPIKTLILDTHAASVNRMPRDLVPWDRSEDTALAKLLASKPTLTVAIAKRCIDNFYDSVVDIQRRPAKGVIPQMLEFYGGAKTQYRHPKVFDAAEKRMAYLRAEAAVGRSS